MKDLKIEIGSDDLASDAQLILKKLIQHNEKSVGRSHIKELTITLKKEDGELIAGLNGFTHWNWLFVKLLWTSEQFRDHGYGSQLMKAAEQEAIKRGAQHAWVDTFSVSAKKFYEKLGYKVFGELVDYPVGHTRIFLFKDLN